MSDQHINGTAQGWYKVNQQTGGVTFGGGDWTPGQMQQVTDMYARQRPANAGDMQSIAAKLDAVTERLDRLIALLESRPC